MEPHYVETDPRDDIFFRILPGKNPVYVLKIRNITDKKVAYKVLIINQRTDYKSKIS